MEITIDNEFQEICRQIIGENLTLEKWRKIESDDMFQNQNYCGGFDANENAFCFSYYDKENREHWFQLTLLEVEKVVSGKLTKIETRFADKLF